MKCFKLFAVAALLLSLSSCGLLSQIDKESQEEAAGFVAKALSEQELAIEVNRIMPMRGPSIPSYDGYMLKIKDGVVNAYLPFFGEAYTSVVYGADSTGIEFKDCPITVDDSQSKPSKGKYVWRFAARCGMEKVYVTVTFWEGGGADIACNPTNRSNISYSGNLIAYPEK